MTKMIMLVDDDPAILNMLSRFFRREKLPVVKAENADAALDLLDAINIDLIVLDIMMPGVNGIELCEQLRQTYSTAKTPIVMLSAKEDIETQRHAMAAGANMFVPKTRGIDMLMNAVNELLA